jgi:hypothetical protein
MYHKLLVACCALLSVALVAVVMLHRREEAKEARSIIGRVEKVYVEGAGITMTARIDTGAGVASVNAEIIEIKKPTTPNGAEIIVFKIEDENKVTKTIEREVIEWQNIKMKGAKGGFIKRPVVEMDLCIGGRKVRGRVNLAERDHFLYPLLVGRNILKAGDFLIDPAKKFVSKPVCHHKKS